MDHPMYNSRTGDDNFAIIKLANAVKEGSSFIKLVDKNDESKLPDQAYTTAWCFPISDSDEGPLDSLRGRQVSILHRETCKQIYGKKFTDQTICTDYPGEFLKRKKK